MALLLAEKWEHALLAAIVKEARKTRGSAYLGRTAFQKIAYFLNVLGVPMRYRFDLYHYGPYCDAVTRDIEWLLADHVIEDQSGNREKYSNYRSGPNCEELLALHAAKLDEHRATIQNIVQALVPLEPERQELIATLDYLFRQLRASKDQSPTKEEVLGRFFEVKGGKFPAETVSAAYDSLASAGLLK
jgi:uncharacterized protein YwgA